MQILICLFIVLAFVGFLVFKYVRDQAKTFVASRTEILTQSEVMDMVVRRMADVAKDDLDKAKDDQAYKAMYNRILRIERAMTDCVYGIDEYKTIVKALIVDILHSIFPTVEELYEVYPLNGLSILPWWEFEILMERLYKKYKTGALAYIITKYNWDQIRYNIEDGTVPSFNVSIEELNEVFQKEMIEPLTPNEAYSVVATIIYSQYKGMGVVDTLRTMDIDGFNFGTSGSIMKITGSQEAATWKANRSVWVYYQGKYIHFRFLEFSSEAEVRRVVQLIARYNNPGPLTEKRGFLVNTMYDKSRVLALRPQAAEYWAVFVRKFSLSAKTLKSLIDPIKTNSATKQPVLDKDGNVIHKYKNAELPLELIKLLMRGQVTTAFTGRQGSGKTTMMTAAISQVDARFNIRVLEMAPEMYLREIYPLRNILSVQETATVTAADLQDALKKSDAALSIVGEVATDIIAARMIQMGQVASIFTIFSHHANRTVDLVHAITNSIVSASGGSATPATVEPQVIDVIKVDAHLDYDVNGNRYIERVTEIIRLDSIPYPERRRGEDLTSYKVRLDKEYYTRRTDRLTFTTRDVIQFDTGTFEYHIARHPDGSPSFFSPELTKHIFSRLPVDERQKWKDWVRKWWASDKPAGV